ncbi:MAG: Ig-like domain-containing protein, partial [Flavisolibacter sp.]
ALFSDPNSGTRDIIVNGISVNGNDAGNYSLANSSSRTSAKIIKGSTSSVLKVSAGVVRYMDQVTLTVSVTPVSKATVLTGTVQFKIGSILFGPPVVVVPVPGDPDGTVQATFIGQVTNLPTASYTVEAMFTSTNPNYGNSSDMKSLQVNQRNADPYNVNLGFYTGDIFAWTTGQNSSTGTIKLSTTIRDNNAIKGDVRAAKVTFYLVNSSGMTPITGATNLPVGLVDINDGSVGSASAIVQLNIGSNNAQDFRIAVGIAGAYFNSASSAAAQAILTISKPIPGGFMVCGGRTQNVASSGYIKGDVGSMTDFESDIIYTKSGTNPKGKADVLIRSHYRMDGTLDSRPHFYIINTNAIASLNVAGSTPATATFSSKANLYEQTDMSLVLIEGGAIFEMVVTQDGCAQQAAITLYRKAGGIWFSNNWAGTRTVPEILSGGQVSVASGGGCNKTVSSSTIVRDPALDETEDALDTKERVYPNPTTSQFYVSLETFNKRDAVSIVVYNVNGGVVEQRQNLTAGQIIQLGAKYRPGVYIIEITQGDKHKRLKLVKIPD